jgi:transcriptional regulator with XRE-family HTH domain
MQETDRHDRDRVATIFGANLQRCRKAAGLTQGELAIAALLHRTEIGLLERGTRLPRIDTLVKLAGSLGVKPEVLLDGLAWSPSRRVGGEFTKP